MSYELKFHSFDHPVETFGRCKILSILETLSFGSLSVHIKHGKRNKHHDWSSGIMEPVQMMVGNREERPEVVKERDRKGPF